MDKKKLRYKCYDCTVRFKSWQSRDNHYNLVHPPEPLPKITIESAENMGDEVHNLLGGRNLKLGDVVWLGRKTVITKIKRVEGSSDIEVTLKITKRWYSLGEIS